MAARAGQEAESDVDAVEQARAAVAEAERRASAAALAAESVEADLAQIVGEEAVAEHPPV